MVLVVWPVMQCAQARAGRPFTLAVREAIRSAQADDPLHPVTVVVASNLAGLSLRRLLGSDLLDPEPVLGRQGIANVSFATPFQLAGRLAATELARSGQRPLTTAVLAAAVRHVLRSEPGRFGAVAEHVSTETALVRAYSELTELHSEQRAVLASSTTEQTADLLRFVEAVSAHLNPSGSAGHHDEYEVLRSASELLREERVDPGSIVLCGPFGQGESTRSFLMRLAASTSTAGVLALTGDDRTDAHARTTFGRVLNTLIPETFVPPARPRRMIPAADPDEEVRAIVRSILRQAELGARFERMAVFHPVQNPYARMLREQFDAAGIPTAGPDHRRMNDSMAGRLLGRVLQLAEPPTSGTAHRLDRDTILSLAAAAPVRGPDGRTARSGAWEIISRKAGVIGGIDDWTEKLERHIDTLRSTVDDGVHEGRSAGFFDALQREANAAGELLTFVQWIDRSTAAAVPLSSWSARSRWAIELLQALLPPLNRRNEWPESELSSADGVEVVLRRVGVLDELEPGAPWSAFVRAIELELDTPAGSRGRFGTGVLIAPMAASAGLDLEHVFILGCAEGSCPRIIREDTLLPDVERSLVGAALSRRPDQQMEERRRFLTALASGASTTLLMPVGDHRNGRIQSASRWWVEAIRGLGGAETLSSSDWFDADIDELEPIRSYRAALSETAARGLATSVADLDLLAVDAAIAQGEPALDTPGIRRPLARSLSMLHEREQGLNRFTGDLSTVGVPAVVDGETAISASRLEAWAGCPRRYFLGQTLGLGAIEAPDEIVEISALDRGSMWHAILENFIAEALPGAPHAPASPDTPWTDADRTRLQAHADRAFAEYEEQGRTGRPLLWEIEKEKLRADLDRFIDSDNEVRMDKRSVPDQVEMAIGFASGPGEAPSAPARVDLPDGRTLRLRGFADRVDRRSTDSSPVVFDYKTGSARANNKMLAAQLVDDPVMRGDKLQLGVYAEAAMQHYGIDRSSAWYWFTSDKGGFTLAGYDWVAENRERFRDVVGTIVDGIETGLFPPNPGEYDSYFGSFANCRYCDFDALCRRDRDAEFAAATSSDRLVDWLKLRYPEDPSGADA
jgi:hypothetical protein